MVGLIPASLSFTVLDVDDGNPLALAFGLRPEFLTNSGTRGRGHLWFLDTESRPNSKWEYTSRTGHRYAGEIRSGNGYVVLWEPFILIDGLMMDHAPLASRTFAEVAQWLQPPTAYPPANPPLRRRQPSGQRNAIDRAVAVIGRIPSDDYDTWVTVGQCLEGSARKGEFPSEVAYTLWKNWSARSGKFPGRGCRRTSLCGSRRSGPRRCRSSVVPEAVVRGSPHLVDIDFEDGLLVGVVHLHDLDRHLPYVLDGLGKEVFSLAVL